MSTMVAVSDFLAGMEYPATKDDLMREAIRARLPWSDLQRLEALPDRSYQGGWQVGNELVGRDRPATTVS